MKRMLSVVLSVCILLTYGVTAYADTPSVEVTTDVLQDGQVELESYIEWNSYKSKIDGCDKDVLDEIRSAEDRGVLPDVYPLSDHSFVVKTDLGFYGFNCIDGVYYSKSVLHFGYFKSSNSDGAVYTGTGTPLGGESHKIASICHASLGCCKIASLYDYGYAPNGDFYIIFSVNADDASPRNCFQDRIGGGIGSGYTTSRYLAVKILNDGNKKIMWHSTGVNGFDSDYAIHISMQDDACYVSVSGDGGYYLDKFEWGTQYTISNGIEFSGGASSATVGSTLRSIANQGINIEPEDSFPNLVATESYGRSTTKYRDINTHYGVTDSGYREMKLSGGIINNYTYSWSDLVRSDEVKPWYTTANGRGVNDQTNGMSESNTSRYQVERFQTEAIRKLNENAIPYIVKHTGTGSREDDYVEYTTKMTSAGSDGRTYTDGSMYLVKKYRPKIGKDGKYVLNTTTVLNIGNGIKHNAMRLTFSDLSLGTNANIKIYGGYTDSSNTGTLLETITNSKNSLGTYTTGVLPYGSVTVVFTAGTSTSGRGMGFNITNVMYSTYKGGKEFNQEKIDVYPVQAPNIGYYGATPALTAVESVTTNSWSTTLNTSSMSTYTDVLLKRGVKVTGNGYITYTRVSGSRYPSSSYLYAKLKNTSTGSTYNIYSSSWGSSSSTYTYSTSSIPSGTYDVYGYTRSTGNGSFTVSCSETVYNTGNNTTTKNISFQATGGKSISTVASQNSLLYRTITVNKTNYTDLANSTESKTFTISTGIQATPGYSVVIPTQYISTSGNSYGIRVYASSPSCSSTSYGTDTIYTFTSSGEIRLYVYKSTTAAFTGSVPVKIYRTSNTTWNLSGSNIKSKIFEPRVEYCSITYKPTGITQNTSNYLYYGNTNTYMNNSLTEYFNTSSSYPLSISVGSADSINSSSSLTLTLKRSLLNLLLYAFDTSNVDIHTDVSGKSVLNFDLTASVNGYSSSLSSTELNKLKRDIFIYDSEGNPLKYNYSVNNSSDAYGTSSYNSVISKYYNGGNNIIIKTRVNPSYASSSAPSIAQTLNVVQKTKRADGSDLSYSFKGDKVFTYNIGADEILFNKLQITSVNIPKFVEVYVDGTKITSTSSYSPKWVAKQFIPVEVRVTGNETYGNLQYESVENLIQYTLTSKYAKDKNTSKINSTKTTVNSTNNEITNSSTGSANYSRTIPVHSGDCYVNPVSTLSAYFYSGTYYGLTDYTLNTGYGTYSGNGGTSSQTWSERYNLPGNMGWFPCNGSMSYSVNTYYDTSPSRYSYIASGKCIDYYYVLKPEHIDKDIVVHGGDSTVVGRTNYSIKDKILSSRLSGLSSSSKYLLEWFGRPRSQISSSRVSGLGYPCTYTGTLIGNITSTLASGSAWVNNGSTLNYDGTVSSVTYYSDSSSTHDYSGTNFRVKSLTKYDPYKLNITTSSGFTSDSRTGTLIANLSPDNETLNMFGDVFSTRDIGGSDTFEDGRQGIAIWGDDVTFGSREYDRLIGINVVKQYSNGDKRVLAKINTETIDKYYKGDEDGYNTAKVKPKIRHIGNDLMFLSADEASTNSPGTDGKSLAWLRTGHWIVNPEEEGVKIGSSYPNEKALSANEESDIDTSISEWKLDEDNWEMNYKIKNNVISDENMQGGLAMSIPLGTITIVKDDSKKTTYKFIEVPGVTSFTAFNASTDDGSQRVRLYMPDEGVIRVQVTTSMFKLAAGEYKFKGTTTVNGVKDVPVALTLKVVEAPTSSGETQITFE